MLSLSLSAPLASRFGFNQKTSLGHQSLLVFVGSLLLALSAQVVIPIEPVNVTLQTLAVLYIGMLYGARLGMLTVLAYLLEGLLGFPVFAGGASGFLAFLSPSGGFLVGFIAMAGVSGFLVQRGWGRYATSTALAALLGTCCMYSIGLIPLVTLFGFHKALAYGVMPFWGIDILKALLLAFSVPLFWCKVRDV